MPVVTPAVGLKEKVQVNFERPKHTRHSGKIMELIGGTDSPRRLTNKQRKFCELMVGRGSKTHTMVSAYREAYDTENMKDATCRKEANRLMNNPIITRTIESYLAEEKAFALHDSARLRRLVLERLHVEATREENTDASRVRALELLGKSLPVSMFSDRVEQVESSRSASEIEQELLNRLAELGVSSKAG